MNYERVFIRLLKDLGCYRRFISNFNSINRYIEYYNDDLDKSLTHFIELSRKRNGDNDDEEDAFYFFINDAFDWNKTPEKFDYWSNIAHHMQAIGKYLCHKKDVFGCKLYTEEELINLRNILHG